MTYLKLEICLTNLSSKRALAIWKIATTAIRETVEVVPCPLMIKPQCNRCCRALTWQVITLCSVKIAALKAKSCKSNCCGIKISTKNYTLSWVQRSRCKYLIFTKIAIATRTSNWLIVWKHLSSRKPWMRTTCGTATNVKNLSKLQKPWKFLNCLASWSSVLRGSNPQSTRE